jgi:hypothetical protein
MSYGARLREALPMAMAAMTAAMMYTLAALRFAEATPAMKEAIRPGLGAALWERELEAAVERLSHRCGTDVDSNTTAAAEAPSDARAWEAEAAACLASASACSPACAAAVGPLRGAVGLLRGLASRAPASNAAVVDSEHQAVEGLHTPPVAAPRGLSRRLQVRDPQLIDPSPDDCGGGGGSNICRYAHDNQCDDGSQGGTQYCDVGTDAADCGGGGGGGGGGGTCRGGTKQGDIISPQDQEWYQFVGQAGATYSFETTLETLDDSVMDLVDTDGTTVLVENDDDSRGGGGGTNYASYIVWSCPTDGTYYVMVKGYSTTTGRFSHCDVLRMHRTRRAATTAATRTASPQRHTAARSRRWCSRLLRYGSAVP